MHVSDMFQSGTTVTSKMSIVKRTFFRTFYSFFYMVNGFDVKWTWLFFLLQLMHWLLSIYSSNYCYLLPFLIRRVRLFLLLVRMRYRQYVASFAVGVFCCLARQIKYKVQDIINLYNSLLKNENFLIKATNG